jgi:hypothetical protein
MNPLEQRYGIANVHGIPGTLGCLARKAADGREVFITNQHVVFAGGTLPGDPVWGIRKTPGGRKKVLLGRLLHGRIGMVGYEGKNYHIDAAIGSIDGMDTKDVFLPATVYSSWTWAVVGSRVSKNGYASGRTEGIVVDDSYTERASVNGVSFIMENQLLIRPLTENRDPSSFRGASSFCEKGDSGAMVEDEAGRVIGLLWGRNHQGEGLASPIGPVLESLDITLM